MAKPSTKPSRRKNAERVEVPAAPVLGLAVVSQVEIASVLGVTSRQVRNLDKQGLPREPLGYPIARCVRWYAEFKQDEALQRAASREAPEDMEEAELRKAVADAEMAELKLSRLRGEVAPIEQYRREMRRVLGRVRARFQSVPGEYASQILEPMDMAKAVAVLRSLVATVLGELQGAGEVTVEDDSEEEVAA